MTTDTEFYQRRMAEERAAAASAADSVVRDRHNKLADLYAARLRLDLETSGPTGETRHRQRTGRTESNLI
jgi:hypothetical protein